MPPTSCYIPAEGRTVLAPRKARAELLSTIPFHWLAPIDPKVSLDSVLLTIKAHAPEQFDECLKLVNLVLTQRDKRIVGFAPAGRLMVEGVTESGKAFQHPVELLSSGEQQMLLMIGFAVGFLRPGGILLIDEPDLHIHDAMVTQLMEALVAHRPGARGAAHCRVPLLAPVRLVRRRARANRARCVAVAGAPTSGARLSGTQGGDVFDVRCALGKGLRAGAARRPSATDPADASSLDVTTGLIVNHVAASTRRGRILKNPYEEARNGGRQEKDVNVPFLVSYLPAFLMVRILAFGDYRLTVTKCGMPSFSDEPAGDLRHRPLRPQ